MHVHKLNIKNASNQYFGMTMAVFIYNSHFKFPLKFPLLINKKWEFKREFKVGIVDKYSHSHSKILIGCVLYIQFVHVHSNFLYLLLQLLQTMEKMLSTKWLIKGKIPLKFVVYSLLCDCLYLFFFNNFNLLHWCFKK